MATPTPTPSPIRKPLRWPRCRYVVTDTGADWIASPKGVECSSCPEDVADVGRSETPWARTPTGHSIVTATNRATGMAVIFGSLATRCENDRANGSGQGLLPTP